MDRHTSLRTSVIIAVSASFVIAAAASLWIRDVLQLGTAYPVTALALFAAIDVLVVRGAMRGHPFAAFGAANVVTTARAALVSLVAALVVAPADARAAAAAIAIATVVTLGDGIDGWLARRTRMAGAFGARFDMETDALLILALSMLVWQHGKAGVWILLAGMLRYLFVAAGRAWPAMRRPLLPSFRRKLVCVAQIVGLLAALLPAIVPPASAAIAALSLALLVWSFAVDTAWLIAARDRIPATAGASASPSWSRDAGV